MEPVRGNAKQLLMAVNREKHEKNRGHLKIFFGYAAGVGKTYAMLQAAHAAKQRGIDVAAGYVEPHARPQTMELLSGLEQIPNLILDYNGITLREFDLDAAMARRPGLILVDELAHTNASICRHAKRYQDVEELLKNGIDVYTTVNVQHIESLNDMVAAVTGIMVRERIPDSVFDQASQVELVDIEPQELLERLGSGNVYKEDQAKKAVENFFTIENLTALREIALRRCADRVNMLSESVRIKKGGEYHTDEHILVCLSSAPSNGKIIRTAARRPGKGAAIPFTFTDVAKSILMLILATGLGWLFRSLGLSESNVIMVYILGVLLTSVITTHQIYSLVSSAVSVIIFNFFFTEPRFTLSAYEKDYPVTFVVMFLSAFLTGSLAVRLKNQARQSAQAAYRTKILFDTNQMLEQVRHRDGIITVTAGQLMKLLNRNLVVYLSEKGELLPPKFFSVSEEDRKDPYVTENERAVANWVLKNNKHAGATTDTLSNAECLYLSVRMNDHVYGVVGIVVGEKPMDAFENSILLSILGECALALENEKNTKEKEEAALLAQKEQLRANLLRSISHDLRTPLTSISGNASNLMFNGQKFDEETKQRLYLDIYDDSMWLINLVENLLSVTRIEEGRMNLHISAELMDEIITEALHHADRKKAEHQITVETSDELLLARADAKLIVQVVINIVDNAIKYTQKGSKIRVVTERKGDYAVVRISDNGPGISDEVKEHVFDMFYSGANKVADSRRSLGLGLSLCKSIVNAHGGEITVSDNNPQGTVFTFTLPVGEVKLHE